MTPNKYAALRATIARAKRHDCQKVVMRVTLAEELLDRLSNAEERIAELQNDEVRQRLANAEHQLHMAELAKHNLRASRKAQFRKRKATERRIAELEAREVKPVAWMRSANVTSFMSRFTTDEKYAVEQWGDDAVALYPLPVAFIPACFTDERNLMHINERGRETSLIWSKQNSDNGDIKLFRIAAAAGKGE